MRTVWVMLLILAACGSVTRPSKDDASPSPGDASPGKDAAPPLDASPDAPPDAPPPLPPGPSREFTGGAGRMHSNSFTFDVQIGHQVGQQPASGNTFKLQGNAAVKP